MTTPSHGATPCPDCRGTGVITAEYGPVNCPTCHGLGKAETPRTQLAQLVTECDRLRADNLMLERACYLGETPLREELEEWRAVFEGWGETPKAAHDKLLAAFRPAQQYPKGEPNP